MPKRRTDMSVRSADLCKSDARVRFSHNPDTIVTLFFRRFSDANSWQLNRKTKIMQNAVFSLRHNNPDSSGTTPQAVAISYPHPIPAAAAPILAPPAQPDTPTSHNAWLRSLIPPEIRDRKFRADSFMMKLTPEQRATVVGWLQAHTPLDVQKMVAAPPPVGFGMQVHRNTLHRLKNLIENSTLNFWLSNGMDAACDVLNGPDAQDVAPMRETIRLLLYNRTLTYIREQAAPASVDRLLSALTRLEKLEKIINSRKDRAPRLKVDVSITSARSTNPVTDASERAFRQHAFTCHGELQTRAEPNLSNL